MSSDQLRKIFKKYSQGQNVIGIGSGRTMCLFSEVLDSNLVYVASSIQSEHFLKNKDVRYCGDLRSIDVYFDGVDYYNGNGDLIKGNGGAAVVEKLMATMAKKTVILAQKNKFRESFDGLSVPVMIIKESYDYFMSKLEDAKVKGTLRRVNNITPFITDQGNLIVDVVYNAGFLETVKDIPGIVGHGYFPSGHSIVIEEIDGEL